MLGLHIYSNNAISCNIAIFLKNIGKYVKNRVYGCSILHMDYNHNEIFSDVLFSLFVEVKK